MLNKIKRASIITLIFFIIYIFSPYLQYAEATIYSSISGTVKDSITGNGVAGVEVFAAQEPFTETSGAGTAITNSEGKYTIEMLPSGSYKIFIKVPSEYVRYDEVKKVSLIMGKNLLNVDFHIMKGGSIEGTVYQSDGITVLPNTKIFVSTDNGFGQGQTDINGKYKVSGLPPALSTTARIVVLGFSDVTRYNLNIISSQVTTGVNITVKTDASISIKGIINDINNLPITNGIVMVESIKSLGIGEVNSDGRYSIKGLISDNSYKVVVIASGYNPYRQTNVVIAKDIPTELNVTLTPMEFGGVTLRSSSTQFSQSSSNEKGKVDPKCYLRCRAAGLLFCFLACGLIAETIVIYGICQIVCDRTWKDYCESICKCK